MMRAAAITIALATLPTQAAGPEYVPDRTPVTPYQLPPRPEDLDRLEIRELGARASAIEARLDRLEAIQRQKRQPPQSEERTP